VDLNCRLDAALETAGAIRRIGSKLSLQRGAKFREGMGNGLRLWVTQNDGHNPKQEKEIKL
jgi:hypothetical protein